MLWREVCNGHAYRVVDILTWDRTATFGNFYWICEERRTFNSRKYLHRSEWVTSCTLFIGSGCIGIRIWRKGPAWQVLRSRFDGTVNGRKMLAEGVVWCDVTWPEVMWGEGTDSIRCGVTWRDVAWCDTVWCNVMWYDVCDMMSVWNEGYAVMWCDVNDVPCRDVTRRDVRLCDVLQWFL